MASNIFISHSSSDSAVAEKVCSILEQAGFRCWIAPRDITPGRSWASCIAQALEESSVMVLILSVRASRSQQVRHELQVADTRKIPVITFRIEEIQLEGTLLYFLGNKHWLDARKGDFRSQITALIAAICKVRGEKDVGISPGPERSKSSWLTTTLNWSAVLVPVTLSAVGFYNLLLANSTNRDESKRQERAQQLVRDGEMYEAGRNGKRQSLANAVWRYRKADELGDAKAAERLGNLFAKGADGIPRDDQIASYYFNRAGVRWTPALADNRQPPLPKEPSLTEDGKQPALNVVPQRSVDLVPPPRAESPLKSPSVSAPNPSLPPAPLLKKHERPSLWVSIGNSTIAEMQVAEEDQRFNTSLISTSLPLVTKQISLRKEAGDWAQGSVTFKYNCKGKLFRKQIQCANSSRIQLRRKSLDQIEVDLERPADMSSKCKSCEPLVTEKIIFQRK